VGRRSKYPRSSVSVPRSWCWIVGAASGRSPASWGSTTRRCATGSPSSAESEGMSGLSVRNPVRPMAEAGGVGEAGLASPVDSGGRVGGRKRSRLCRRTGTLEVVPKPCLKHRPRPAVRGKQGSAPLRHRSGAKAALSCADGHPPWSGCGAGDRDRTGMASLEGWGSTIELHPRGARTA
jgi:hypothetical protein